MLISGFGRIKGDSGLGAVAAPTYIIQPIGPFALDGYMDQASPVHTTGLDATVFIGNMSPNAKRAIFEFPLRSIKPGATIIGAQLRLSTITSPANNFAITIERLQQYGWDHPVTSWNEWLVGAAWVVAGGDVSTVPAALSGTAASSGDVVITGLETFVQDAIDNRAMRLIVRIKGAEATTDQIEVASGHFSDHTKAPRLFVLTNESGLGYARVGIKKASSGWAASRDNPPVYMAVGIGNTPATGESVRNRLKEEIYRVPVLGVNMQGTQASVVGVFDAGKGTGKITEVGLFNRDSTTVVNDCESLGAWSLSTDLRADMIIGQPSFKQTSHNSVVPGRVWIPVSCYVDRNTSPQLLYLNDSGNNRVLIFDADAIVAAATASPGSKINPTPLRVTGQSDFVSSWNNGDSGYQTFPVPPTPTALTRSSNPITQGSLDEAGSGSGFVVASNGDIIMTDFWNHRVLRYPRISSTAIDVWGQADFVSNLPNRGRAAPANNSFWFTWGLNNDISLGIDLDTSGNLWVTDSNNYRILRFPFQNGVIQKIADLVIGQSSGLFTTRTSGGGLNQLGNPTSLRVSTSTGKVYVADPENRRVMVYSDLPFTSGMSGVIFRPAVVAVSSITRSGSTATVITSAAHGLTTGRVVEILGAVQPEYNGLFFITFVDSTTFQYTVSGTPATPATGSITSQGAWNRPQCVDTDPTHSGYIWVMDSSYLYLMKESDCTELANTRLGNGDGNQMSGWGPLGVTTAGDVFTTCNAGQNAHNVLLYLKNGSRVAPTLMFDVTPFKTPNQVDKYGLGNVYGIAAVTAASPTQLIVADNTRVLFWNNLGSLATGKGADGYLSSDITTATDFTSVPFSSMSMAADSSGGYLWVSTAGVSGQPSKVLCYALPLTVGAAPIKVITFPLNALGGGTLAGGAGNPIDTFWGVLPNADSSELWLAQSNYNRVVRIRNPLGTPLVDVVLGQPDITTSTTGTALNKMNAPGAIGRDNSGNIYVSDSSLETAGNWRILMFLASQVPSNNPTIILGPTATKAWGTGFRGTDSVTAFQMAFDKSNRMLIGTNYQTPGPPAGSGTSTAVGAQSLTDSTANWTIDRFAGAVVTSGAKTMSIASNTATVITGIAPWGGGAPGVGAYTIEADSRHVAYYDDPINGPTTTTGQMRDYNSSQYAVVFDSGYNLYVGDLNRNRVLIYNQPFTTIQSSLSSTRVQGSYANRISIGAGMSVISLAVNADLHQYNLDDYIQFWLRVDVANAITDMTLVLTDDLGTWTWAGLGALESGTFKHFMLRFKDAITTSLTSGPNTVSAFQLTVMSNESCNLDVDYIRVISGSEELLLWVAPTIPISKSVTQRTKFFVDLTSKQGSN